jgi:hypothetical protein
MEKKEVETGHSVPFPIVVNFGRHEFLATGPQVPGSITGSTIFYD